MTLGAHPVDAVFLDVGGVFHVPDHARIGAALARAGVHVDPGRLDRAHFAGAAALAVWPDGVEGMWRAYEEAYAREAGVPDGRLEAAIAELDEAFAEPGMWSRHVPGSVDALRALAATGVCLVIVSNSDGTLEERLRAEGVCQVGPGPGVDVTAILDSAVVGVAKPDPGIFQLALQAAGADPAAVLHVGDTVGSDVVGARASGVRPVHLDPYGFCADNDHFHLRDLAELVAVVERLGGRRRV
jgi:putative hydrolase of the HAD superfamily